MSEQILKDPGLPKWTRPVSIAAYSITSLPIDIIAQTIGNIEIDIAAQSLENVAVNIAAAAVTLNVATAVGEHVDTDIISSVQLDINIAASAVTLDINIASQAAFNITVDIAAQSVGNLSINIAASAISLNVTTTAGEHVDTDIVSSITLNVDVVAQTVGNILIDIAAQSVGNISINIAASAISLNVKTTIGEHVDTDIVSSVQIGVDIEAQSVGNIAIDISAQSVGNVAVNIAASAITLNVNISSQSVTLNIKTAVGEHVDTDIVSSVTLNIDVVAQTVGNINIDIAEQSVGNLNINLAASAVTLDVDITAQTVDLNIKTSGGANIVIDKLTQTAYTERRSTIGNPTAGTPPSFETAAYVGKFFPRGMRGFITSMYRYVKSTTGAQQEVWAFAPYPGAGEIFTCTENWAGAAELWGVLAAEPPDRFWNYDSMFIYLKSKSGDRELGYDAVTPYDGYASGDSGVSWDDQNRRYYIRVEVTGETVGDLPVSGTINNVKIPSTSTGKEQTAVSCTTGTITSIITMYGAGTILWLRLQFGADLHSSMDMRIYIDGSLIKTIVASTLGQAEFDEPPIEIETVTGYTSFNVFLPFEFTRSIEIKGRQNTGDTVSANGLIVANKIS